MKRSHPTTTTQLHHFVCNWRVFTPGWGIFPATTLTFDVITLSCRAMRRAAPLNVTVEIQVRSGSARGQRRFRQSHRIELPPCLYFTGDLPIEGKGEGRVTFTLPQGNTIQSAAILFHDPEFAENGSSAELVGLSPDAVSQITSYLESRLAS